MKVIFLDIDGVLNSATGTGPYVSDMEVSKLEVLNGILKVIHFDGVVITSDRRYSDVDMFNKLDAFDQYEIKVMGQIRKPDKLDFNDNRGQQILDFLADSDEEVESIIILDDNDDGISNIFNEDFIQVNRFYGLNDDISRKIINRVFDKDL